MERRVVFSGWLFPAFLLMPQLAVTVVFFFWPAAQAVLQSVRREDAFGLSTRFVATENFTAVLSDPFYPASAEVTLLFSVAVAVLALASGMLLAVMADRVVRGAAVYKTVLLLPYAVAPAIAGVLWLFLFNPSIGIVAVGLRRLGVDWNYLLDADQAMLLVILAAAWKQISYNFLFFLAGLQSIPASLLEASAIDGASPRRRFWTIVFPLLAPTSFFLLVVNIVYAFFDTFGVIHNVTQGGPAKATEILVYKVWYDGMVGLDLGSSAAQSVILMAIVIGLTAIQFRFIERRVHYARALRMMVTARSSAWLPHTVLVTGLALVVFPVYVAFVGSTLTASDILDAPMSLLPGPHLFENFALALGSGTVKTSGEPVAAMLLNSLVMALVIAGGKILISLPSAYAVVFFRFPLRRLCFWAIFVTLMLPVEVRIIPTYKIAADLSLIDTYAGLTLPLVASATATLLFRQFFLTIPDELVEAAKIDGAGPWRFLIDTVIPLSRTNIAALFVILFIYGWNQYLWPLLVTNTPSMTTIVIGIRQMIGNGDTQTEWPIVMATTLLAVLPPVLVVLLMQRWFVKGLVEAEK